MKVKSITLKGFRGATQPASVVFDTSKSLSLIFGENGTGKSTIIDGFDFLCDQRFGSLENYSIGKSAKTLIPSQGKKPADCFVELVSDVTDQEVTDFAKAVIAIADAVICPDCCSWPKKNSGSYWHCSCKENQLELHPLTQPGATPRSTDDGE